MSQFLIRKQKKEVNNKIMESPSMQPIQQHIVEPSVSADASAGVNPAAIRYGWCKYADINLVNGDGTMSLYVQPPYINEGEGTVPNPYHRVLPKGQLIPFPTFDAFQQMPSPDITNSRGQALMVDSVRQMTSLEAIVTVLRDYSRWGFTVLTALQGLDQATAYRIFTVVQPLDYPLKQILNELSFGAIERIDATESITFPGFEGYVVEPLRNDFEREIARRLASEMEAGATITVDLASTVLDNTMHSITARHSGGVGKTGPDKEDTRLSAELGRELPRLIANESPQDRVAGIENKIDMLSNLVTSQNLIQSQQNEIAELRRQLQQESAVAESAVDANGVCGFIKDDGSPCGSVTKNGEPCRWHK